MADNLTIRMSDELKARVEAAATAADQSMSDFINRVVKLRLDGACPRCGRDTAPLPTVAVAPGTTPELRKWMTAPPSGPIQNGVIVSSEKKVYRGGFFAPVDLTDTMLTVHIKAPHFEGPVPVPRAFILGWDQGQRGEDLRRALIAVGYIDVETMLSDQNAPRKK